MREAKHLSSLEMPESLLFSGCPSPFSLLCCLQSDYSQSFLSRISYLVLSWNKKVQVNCYRGVLSISALFPVGCVPRVILFVL